MHSTVDFITDYTYWPQLSGYYLPAGTYKAEKEDEGGVFFRSPAGMKVLAVTGSTPVQGGIYLPKVASSNIWGHVYLQMPLVGWETYTLPSYFFSTYGKKWTVCQQ